MFYTGARGATNAGRHPQLWLSCHTSAARAQGCSLSFHIRGKSWCPSRWHPPCMRQEQAGWSGWWGRCSNDLLSILTCCSKFFLLIGCLTTDWPQSMYVYAHIWNSNVYPGFATGKYEGSRVVILSGKLIDAIEVHTTSWALTIPGRYLFPQWPTSAKGQVMVITKGWNAGEVYITHAQNESGLLPLVEQGKAQRGVKCYVGPSRLAKCNLK